MTTACATCGHQADKNTGPGTECRATDGVRALPCICHHWRPKP